MLVGPVETRLTGIQTVTGVISIALGVTREDVLNEFAVGMSYSVSILLIASETVAVGCCSANRSRRS